MDSWVGIIELQFGSAGEGLQGTKSSGCLLRLAVVIERQLKTYQLIRGQSSMRALSQECRTWDESGQCV